MRMLILFFAFNFFYIYPTYSQRKIKPSYDTLWYFSPFSIDVLAGIWTPTGKLSEYYNPSAQVGASFGLKIRKVRFQLWIMSRFLNQKKYLELKVKDSVVDVRTKSGASLGGWFSYTLYQNKHISTEIMTGITYEYIATNIRNPNRNSKRDSLLSVSGVGISSGFNTWFNTFDKLNFGFRTIYTYATYNKSKNLAKPIGGNSITFSLLYRFPKRSQDFRKWY